jgi:hypothetical protein
VQLYVSFRCSLISGFHVGKNFFRINISTCIFNERKGCFSF